MRKKKKNKSGGIFVLVDPEADFGKTKHRWPFFREQLFREAGECEVQFVSPERSVEKLTQAAIAAEAEKLVLFGSDSTTYRAVNQILGMSSGKRGMATKAAAEKLPAIGIFCSGIYSQGLFLSMFPQAKKLSERDRLELCVRSAVSGKPQAVDLGCAQFRTSKNSKETRHFVNMASYGISEKIVENMPKAESAIHSGVAYMLASLRALANFQAPEISITVPRKTLMPATRILNLFIANGAFGAGSMRIAPQAKLTDGKLHVLVIPEAPVSELMMELPKLWLADKEISGAVRATSNSVGAECAVKVKSRIRLELDGVLTGYLPAKFTVAPKAIRLLF